MPFVYINYEKDTVPQAVMRQVVDTAVKGLADALTCDDEGGAVSPEGVRVFVQERGPLDVSIWDIDITVMTNDLPGRHNLQERLAPVDASLRALLEEQAPGVAHCLWSNLHGPFAFFDPGKRLL